MPNDFTVAGEDGHSQTILQRAMERTLEQREKQKLGLLSTSFPGRQIDTSTDQPGVEALRSSQSPRSNHALSGMRASICLFSLGNHLLRR